MGKDERPTGEPQPGSRARVFWSVWTGVWLVPTLVFGLVVPLFEWTGWDSARDGQAAMGGVIIALVTGALAAVGVIRVRSLRRTTYRLDPPPPRAARRGYRSLPRPGSAARAPMQRLAEAEATLEELLDQIDDRNLPPDWVDRTWDTVSHTSAELRAIAEKIQAVERSVKHAPSPAERESLTRGVQDLLGQVDRGLQGYDRLIAVAGQAVVASASTVSVDELTDATDHLAGLAQALRELR